MSYLFSPFYTPHTPVGSRHMPPQQSNVFHNDRIEESRFDTLSNPFSYVAGAICILAITYFFSKNMRTISDALDTTCNEIPPLNNTTYTPFSSKYDHTPPFYSQPSFSTPDPLSPSSPKPSPSDLNGHVEIWQSETAINCALQATIGTLVGACLSYPITGCVCAAGYSLLKSSFVVASEATHIVKLEQTQKQEDTFLQGTINKVTGIVISVLILPLLPLLFCIHVVAGIALANMHLIQDESSAWLSMGLVYTAAVLTSYISVPSAMILAVGASCVDRLQDAVIGNNRINRVLVQSFNTIAQEIYPWPLNRMLTCSY